LKNSRVDVERVVADGDRKLLADERQVAAEFEEEIAEVGEDRLAELLLGVLVAQPEELQDVVVLERQQVALLGVIGQALFWVAPDRHVPQVQAGIDLPAKFADRPTLARGHGQIEVAFVRSIADGHDFRVVRPGLRRHQLDQGRRRQFSGQCPENFRDVRHASWSGLRHDSPPFCSPARPQLAVAIPNRPSETGRVPRATSRRWPSSFARRPSLFGRTRETRSLVMASDRFIKREEHCLPVFAQSSPARCINAGAVFLPQSSL
jgi:hypothetical protein